MASLKKIQEKMSGVKKTAKVTKAMESISAIKMRAAQKKAIGGRDYAFLVFSILKRISKVVGRNVDEIFAGALPQDGKTLLLLISPDKGLTGGMNNFLFKKVENTLAENELSADAVSFVCVGKKGYEFAQQSGYTIEKYFEGISEKAPEDEMEEISLYIEKLYREGAFTKAISIYTNFINTTEQKPVVRTMLPVVYDEMKDLLKDITPTKGKFSDTEDIDIDHADVAAYIFEPSIEAAVESLVPFVLHIALYNSLLESYASEHSSRMIAMKNSTDKANELAEDLRKKFNKERQALITKEISEIVSGIEAMK